MSVSVDILIGTQVLASNPSPCETVDTVFNDPAGDLYLNILTGTLDTTTAPSPCESITDPTDPEDVSIVSTCPLSSGTVSLPYSLQLEGAGGLGDYSWEIVAGSLPDGLTLSVSGLLSGTPTGAGTSTFTLKITSVIGGTNTKACSLVVSLVQITTTCPLTEGEVGAAYSQQFDVINGTAPYTWSLLSGAFPDGLSMSSSGLLSGTPTVADTFSFTVKVIDNVGVIATKSCQVTIATNCFDFTDDFNRADGAIGASYTLNHEISGVDPCIVSNQMAASAGCTLEVTAAPDTNTTGYSEITWVTYASVAWGGPMVLRRTEIGKDNRYVLKTEDLGGAEPRAKLSIVKNYNGALTTLASVSPVLLSGLLGVPLKLEFEVQASLVRLTAYLNGSQILTADDSDATRMTTGKPGFSIVATSGGVSNKWDNLTVHTCP